MWTLMCKIKRVPYGGRVWPFSEGSSLQITTDSWKPEEEEEQEEGFGRLDVD